MVHEIDHMSDLHIDSSFHKQTMKIAEWIDSSIGQSTVIQQLDKKGLHYFNTELLHLYSTHSRGEMEVTDIPTLKLRVERGIS